MVAIAMVNNQHEDTASPMMEEKRTVSPGLPRSDNVGSSRPQEARRTKLRLLFSM